MPIRIREFRAAKRSRALAVGLALMAGCTDGGVPRNAYTVDSAALTIDSLRCADPIPGSPCRVYRVSLLELITQPSTWHGKRVQVIGYAQLHDEESLLYASESDFHRTILANAVRLPFVRQGRDTLNHRDLLVEGVFNARRGGSLKQLTRFEPWITHTPDSLIPNIQLRPPH